MRKTLKRVLSTTLATLMLASTATLAVSAAEEEYQKQKLYTFEEAREMQWDELLGEFETVQYRFYMPDNWYNEYNNGYDGSDPSTYAAGVYWWEGIAMPGAFGANTNDWPGYLVTEKDPDCDNVFIATVPAEVPLVMWNNSVNGGKDPLAPWYTEAKQTGYAPVTPYEPNSDKYGFYPDGLESKANMIFVCNPADVSVDYNGKEQYEGEWFYYYGNGEYGFAPTREEAGNNVYSDGVFPPTGLVPPVTEITSLGVGAEFPMPMNKKNAEAYSEDEAIATVTKVADGEFVVTGVAEGTTNVVFQSFNENTNELNEITVPVTVIKAEFDRTSITLNVGEEDYVFGIGLGSNAEITYSKKGIVTYDPVGMTVKAKKVGTTTVTATQGGNSISFKATVKPVFTKANVSLKAGKTATLKVKGGTVSKYTSSNPKVATVSKKGVVTALTKGTAKITATVNGQKTTCTVKVTSDPKLAKTSITVGKGKKTTVAVTGAVSKPKVGTCKVAKITAAKTKLTVVGKSKGTNTVTVTVNGKKLKLKVTVK